LGILGSRKKNGIDRKVFLQLWDIQGYEEIYRLSSEQLSQKPLDFFLLTIHGFSAYQLAIAQINSFNMLNFMDTCIWSLRKALLFKEGANDGRLFYVLGKAYYYKGSGYGDLAIKYLKKAGDIGFDADDIPEYLGLAYASVRDYRNSVAAFTLALDPREDDSSLDTLLLAIANSYSALDEYETAQSYLIRCLDISRDSNAIFTARLNLGEILFKKGDIAGAEEQYLKVNEESGGNAEAHFRLGELYTAQGETVRGRAEWRRAVQIDPSHRLARERLNI
jgi:tetratricopeptide (TPR) repeat protein